MADHATGILKRSGGGALLVNAVAPAQGAVRVPARLVQQFALVEGATVGGPVRQARQGRELATVETVCGLTPEAYRQRPRFSGLIALDPSERFNLGATGDVGMRAVDLLERLARLTRAFDLRGSRTGRSLSGGIDAGALELPRRFLGLARNVEHGASVTILATVLVDTGSRQDQLIYEELKSTGNSEIVLDRALAEARLFPAIDVHRSGTRKEERLYSEVEMAGLVALRSA